MYPFIRSAITLFKASRSKSLGIHDVSEIQFHAMPWDCDMFFEVNNGRQLTLFEQGLGPGCTCRVNSTASSAALGVGGRRQLGTLS